jgi:NhaP-type Na+/H+ or K+/H+ antiporter
MKDIFTGQLVWTIMFGVAMGVLLANLVGALVRRAT